MTPSVPLGRVRQGKTVVGPSGPQPSGEEIAAALHVPESTETIHHILKHLAANADHGVENGDGVDRTGEE